MASSPRCARVRLEVLAIAFAVAVIATVAFLALSFPEEKFYTSGHSLPLNLEVVRPDESDALYDIMGKRVGTSAFNGTVTKAWVSNSFRRDFILRLPEGVQIQPVGYRIKFGQEWETTAENLLQPPFLTGSTYTVASTFPDTYWHSSMFFSSSRDVEAVDVTLSFYLTNRGPPLLTFPGPFVAGITNRAAAATQSWWRCELLLLDATNWASVPSMPFHFSTTIAHLNQAAVTFLDKRGQRHFPVVSNAVPKRGMWVWDGNVSGLTVSNIASVEVHMPEEKTFHHVRIRYPDRPNRKSVPPTANQ